MLKHTHCFEVEQTKTTSQAKEYSRKKKRQPLAAPNLKLLASATKIHSNKLLLLQRNILTRSQSHFFSISVFPAVIRIHASQKRISSTMERTNKQYLIFSWCSCLYYIIVLLLLATNIPTSHQIRNSQEFEKEVLNNERGVLDRRVCGGLGPSSPIPVKLRIQEDYVIMDNSIVQITISKPGGLVVGIRYNDLENLLEVRNRREDRGYWDLNWSGGYEKITGTGFSVIKDDGDQVEVSFTTTWNPSHKSRHRLIPLNIDKRFILMRGCSGFYSYAIYEHLEGWPDFDLGETRMVFKLRKDKFRYMAISDERQRIMPTPEDRSRGKRLAYEEAVLLTNPTNTLFKGEVDDKYQYSSDNKDNKVHGWISSNPAVGFWIITPSGEFRTGGPLKQDLTSHVGPTALAMFMSGHYTGDDMELNFTNGEPWKKVFGPVFIYLNSASVAHAPYATLWEDAKAQMMMEVQSWPYNFPVSEDFPRSDQRGSVIGRLLVRNRYSAELVWASSAYVGLAPLGEAGSWQKEAKGYQFWTTADANGSFSIRNVRTGEYNLFAWVPGFIGDYQYQFNLTISAGYEIELGNLVFEPPRDGPTMWEMGIPDRSAAEFYIPDPNPMLINRLYVDRISSDGKRSSGSTDKFRQYGLWSRYTDLYPRNDLVYTVGVSDYRKDWFFAQPTRRRENGTFEATTWQIKFIVQKLCITGTYKLRLALASATYAELQVDFNKANPIDPLFTTRLIGKDNAIARHGIHGLYWLFSVDVPGNRLIEGENTIFLTQARGSDVFRGIMYDYIRLEGPSQLDYCKN